MSRSKWLCLDCKVDTGKIGEHYMLIDSVWNQAHGSATGMLCVEHVEKRLGRRLRASDFKVCYVNAPRTARRSQRLTERLVGYAGRP